MKRKHRTSFGHERGPFCKQMKSTDFRTVKRRIIITEEHAGMAREEKGDGDYEKSKELRGGFVCM